MKITTLVSFLLCYYYYYYYYCIYITLHASAKCLPDQQSVLLQFKNNFKLLDPETESFANLNLWNNSTDCCHWSGVTCDNEGHVTYLDLSNCQLYGTLPDSLSNLTHLTTLDLSYNDFSGAIPSYLFTLPSIETISLEFNHFNKLDELINVFHSFMKNIYLSNNDLSGPFPMPILQLHSLSVLDLSSNRLNGSLQLDDLLKLRNLTELNLSYNNISINMNDANVNQTSFPNINDLGLASCNLKSFPIFLTNQSDLVSLDLSDNQIHGKIPNWIWKQQNLFLLNLSHNFLSDLEGPLQNLSSYYLRILDLHNNKLLGSIPIFSKFSIYLDYSINNFSVFPQDIGDYMSATTFLSLSNNNLQGSFPNSLCNASNLQVLDISLNNFSGTISPCLIYMTGTLEVLNLGNNNLTGPIPDIFPTSCVLRTLNFHGNLLHGPIPNSLSDCSVLELFDIGSNQIVGGFPCFLPNIPTLRVLVLRNNKFHGSIECSNSQENQHWKSMQIVDIAFNNFNGKLPAKYFTTWDRMIRDEDHVVSDFIHIYEPNEYVFSFKGRRADTYYQDSVTVSAKGQQMELVKILRIFTVIDFSSNHFEGPIPEVLMDFKAIHVLNFSNNALSGEIPSTIGNMKQLESLDLSNNCLVGEIPMQIASLSFLSYLNLSFNHFVGKIPTGTQLQSFEASSFEGNDELYGSPLTEKPFGSMQDLHPQPANGIPGCSIDWSFLSVELGIVFGLGVIVGPILFWKQWRVRYWKLVDKILCWIFSRMYLEYATHRGQTYTVLRWR